MHAKQNGSLILTMITEMKLIGYCYAQSSWSSSTVGEAQNTV